MTVYHEHAVHDRRSLAMARLIARRIESDPERRGLALGLEQIRRWRESGGDCYWKREWERIIRTEDWHSIRHILLQLTDKGQQYRQTHPFGCVITQEERARIFRKHSRERVRREYEESGSGRTP